MIAKLRKQIGTYRTYLKRKKFIRTEMAPEPGFKDKPLEPPFQEALRSLREHGYCHLDLFGDLADHILSEVFEKAATGDFNDPRILKNVQKPEDLKMGRKMAVEISYKDEKWKDFFFHPQLVSLLYNYYRRQPYYRNYPWLVMHQNDDSNLDWKNNPVFQGKYHLDQGKHQVSYILLLNDLGENDTRLQFAKDSHKVDHFSMDRNDYPDEMIEEKYEIVNCIGPKGRLYIFDAGNGFHRAKYFEGSTRKILHCNFTTGHSIVPTQHEDLKQWEWLRSQPEFIQKTVEKISK